MAKVYLAIPYSSWDAEKSFDVANKVAADLMAKGDIVFSPISHSHPIQAQMDESYHTHEHWMKQDLPFVDWCDKLVIVYILHHDGQYVRGGSLLEGSIGCKTELMRATLQGKEIEFYEYTD